MGSIPTGFIEVNPSQIMTTQRELGKMFRNGETSGSASNVEIREVPGGTVVLGYGHAIYASRDETGMVTVFDWYGNRSMSTSCQISKMGLNDSGNYDEKREGMPKLQTVRHGGIEGLLMENPLDQ